MKVIPNPSGYGNGEGVIIKLSQEELDELGTTSGYFELLRAIGDYYKSFPKV